jgi:hypothetical protein
MFRVSLRQMLAAAGIFAFVIVSLRYSTAPFHFAVSTIAMVALFAAAIFAVVDRGHRQAFAIGVVLTIILYGGLILYSQRTQSGDGGRNDDLDIAIDRDAYQLGTTYLLRLIHPLIADRIRIPIPREVRFMEIGHLWWALLFGYLGGRFSQFVYLRRTKEADS